MVRILSFFFIHFSNNFFSISLSVRGQVVPLWRDSASPRLVSALRLHQLHPQRTNAVLRHLRVLQLVDGPAAQLLSQVH